MDLDWLHYSQLPRTLIQESLTELQREKEEIEKQDVKDYIRQAQVNVRIENILAFLQSN